MTDAGQSLKDMSEKYGRVPADSEHGISESKMAIGNRVMPCGRFYANVRWWRFNCLCYKMISIMKRKALPKSISPARMKALRLHLIGVAGKVVWHARMMLLKITEGPIAFHEARGQLVEFSST